MPRHSPSDYGAREKQLPSGPGPSTAAGSGENSFPPCYAVILEMPSNSKIPVGALANSTARSTLLMLPGDDGRVPGMSQA